MGNANEHFSFIDRIIKDLYSHELLVIMNVTINAHVLMYF